MTIKTTIQGTDPTADRELFGLLGTLLTDARVHDQLGMAVTTRPGDIWHVALDKHGGVNGFAVVRPLKSRKSAHIRYLFAINSPIRTQRSLVEKIIADARDNELEALHTNDRASNTTWAQLGFKIIPSNRRGAFVRWQLDLEKAS